jgi:hypothetical protein
VKFSQPTSAVLRTQRGLGALVTVDNVHGDNAPIRPSGNTEQAVLRCGSDTQIRLLVASTTAASGPVEMTWIIRSMGIPIDLERVAPRVRVRDRKSCHRD